MILSAMKFLLHNHYRCNQQIIEFNNKKYYNDKLAILSKSEEKEPLVFIDVADQITGSKNTAPGEAEEIIRYAASHPKNPSVSSRLLSIKRK